MLTLWKSQVVPNLDYGAPLTDPLTQEQRRRIEGLQRSFTDKINIPKNIKCYYDRLEYLKLYSLQRRRERYSIILTWKILEGFVPNLKKNSIQLAHGPEHRNGRMCKVPKHRANYQLLFENSFCVRGPNLFNALPMHLRNTSGEHVRLDTFKHRLDKWLSKIKDEPPLDGVVLTTYDNSLVNWRNLLRKKKDRTTHLPFSGGD